MYFNLHTHHPTLSPGVLEVESIYFTQKKTFSGQLKSVGLHPWHLNGIDMQEASQWLNAEIAQKETIAIGETGLDKACNAPWDLQVKAFQLCVEISEQAQKPLILHCVRAYTETLAFRKAWNAQQPWIYHGFNKNMPTALMLLRAGCYLSFGKDLFNEKNHAAESLLGTPEGRFFLETDDSGLDIRQVYVRAATVRSIPEEILCAQMLQTAQTVFGLDL